MLGMSYIAYLNLELIVTFWVCGQYSGYKEKAPVSWEVSFMGNPESLGNIKSVEDNKKKNVVILSISSFPTRV